MQGRDHAKCHALSPIMAIADGQDELSHFKRAGFLQSQCTKLIGFDSKERNVVSLGSNQRDSVQLSPVLKICFYNGGVCNQVVCGDAIGTRFVVE